jgi:L-lactate dehydrogenase complex protein LldE
MTVRLMLTCLCDAFYGDVGIATVKVLEDCGCTVTFDSSQTCCGQPAFNAGDWSSARPVASLTVSLFGLDQEEGDPVVTPSASCAAMLRHGYSLIGVPCANRVYELCEFVHDQAGRHVWGGSVKPRRVGFHRACHGRMMGLRDQQSVLLASIEGVEIVEFGSQEQCCGFGGAFSMTHGKVSEGIGLEKLRQLETTGVEQVVSGDMGCLMHLQGLAMRHNMDMRFAHVAQLMAEAIGA